MQGLTVHFDGECGVDLAPDIPGLAPVHALVLLHAQVGDDQRRLSSVRLQVRGHQHVAILRTRRKKKNYNMYL